MHKPLGRGTATVTDSILSAASTGTAAHVAIIVKGERIAPNIFEALRVQVASFKFLSLEEGTGIDFPLWANAAGCGSRSAGVQARQFVAKGVEVKERVCGQHVGMSM